ncbi:hypothetical protein, partial [Heyndrickxia sporothermodurans]|uniref:hypothetical protein n=1 Tax=Heyndrickxia sporothermodurans TaxID=46224 RepID=UPI001F2CEC56
GNLILSEVVLIFIQKIIKAGEILLVVKIHRLFHLRGGFCPSLSFLYIINLGLFIDPLLHFCKYKHKYDRN